MVELISAIWLMDQSNYVDQTFFNQASINRASVQTTVNRSILLPPFCLDHSKFGPEIEW
jgi:hypothetical protein